MRYYLIAGEASGDLHGSNLIRGIRKADSGAVFRFWGGDKMAEAGGAENLAMHYKKASFMGFTEVLLHLRTIFRQMDECKADIAAFRPDVLILIDYAGFNLRIARFAKENGIPTYYYIAPKVWAWKESRVKKIRKYVDRLFVIFPFEIDYFRSKGIAPVYEGNPLIDSIDQRRMGLLSRNEFAAQNGLDGRPEAAGRKSVTTCRSWSNCRNSTRNTSSSWPGYPGSISRCIPPISMAATYATCATRPTNCSP